LNDQLLLGIETSCDESSAALLRDGQELIGHVILSQDIHRLYGGVVPELAARAHLAVLDDVVREVMAQGGAKLGDVDAIGVTAGPGLIGALLVGVSWAKGAAFSLGCPLVPVHHMEAHLFAPGLENREAEPPFVALLVSGGHTLLLFVEEWGRYLLLGETRDDAAGEAFDKVAKLLDLPYPGGPGIEVLAREGDPRRHPFPRPMLQRNQLPEDPNYFDFSFSGLKTAVAERARTILEEGKIADEAPHIAAGFQGAAIDLLVSKTMRAVELMRCPRVLLGGGVSANRALRGEMEDRLGPSGRVFYASPRLSLDNGAMVAKAAAFRFSRGETAGWDLNADAALPFPGLDARRFSGFDA
jgi:N6-L-threonylcarbamoyladenine synthase